MAKTAQSDNADERLDLAFAANHQIAQLAEMLRKGTDGTQDHPMIHGVTARIELLTHIIMMTMKLHGTTDEDAGYPGIESLRRNYEGRRS